MVESELFGHARGAFTGADNARQGLLELANDATVFFDEAGDIPPSVQVKLLRVLEQRELTPVGSADARPTAFRVIAASNRDLRGDSQGFSIRRDLYFRLAAFEIVLTPLRERVEDIPLLAEHFLGRVERHGRQRRALRPRPWRSCAAGAGRVMCGSYGMPSNTAPCWPGAGESTSISCRRRSKTAPPRSSRQRARCRGSSLDAATTFRRFDGRPFVPGILVARRAGSVRDRASQHDRQSGRGRRLAGNSSGHAAQEAQRRRGRIVNGDSVFVDQHRVGMLVCRAQQQRNTSGAAPVFVIWCTWPGGIAMASPAPTEAV